MSSTQDEVKKAFFKKQGDPDTNKIEVHFNPASLNYVISNTLEEKGQGNSKKQYVSKSTGKLTMDLIFDTTGTGDDVRLHTVKIAKFMEPDSEKVPAIIDFEWGLYTFKGMLESYKETIDFFSGDGVPLRASLNLTLSSQDQVFEGGSADKKSNTGGGLDAPTSLPATAPPGKGITDTATKAGNPDAARAIASANGAESLRFPGSASLELDASIELKGPEIFSSGGGGAGINLGISAGAGVGAGAGIGAGIGASANLSVGASAGIGVSGGVGAGASAGISASAGVSASAGAFSQLRTPSVGSASKKLNLDKFSESAGTAGIGLGASASIGIGGSATAGGSASMKTNVGAEGDLKARIEFSGG